MWIRGINLLVNINGNDKVKLSLGYVPRERIYWNHSFLYQVMKNYIIATYIVPLINKRTTPL